MIQEPGPHAPRPDETQGPAAEPHRRWHYFRNRLIEGLLVVLPLLVTFWFIRWLYSGLDHYVIEPLAGLVIWKAKKLTGEPDLPYWFENIVAPIISLVLAVLIVYGCGVIAHTRVRKCVDNFLLKVPLVSQIFEALRAVLKVFDKPAGAPVPRRIVLVPFPHPGMRLPAIVTSTCKDMVTGRTLLCVYVPTTPVPASGFFLMLPEEEATELNWDVQQTLQAIISGGLTAPPEVSYFKKMGNLENAPENRVPVAGDTRVMKETNYVADAPRSE
jgi:uncharacterized membrane protein